MFVKFFATRGTKRTKRNFKIKNRKIIGRNLRPVQKMKIVNIEEENTYIMYLQNKE